MDEHKLRELLEAVQGGGLSTNEALQKLRKLPFEDLGHTKIDHHRGLRAGAPEVIYALHKSAEQVVDIALQILKGGQNLLVTRTNEAQREVLRSRMELVTPDFDKSLELQIQKLTNFRDNIDSEKPKYLGRFLKEAGTLAVWQHAGFMPADRKILILTAGTSDLNVAQEAAETARLMGCNVDTISDVGVAGIHRLLAHVEEIQKASIIIVLAGMEGALASVTGGLVDVPVIAVPTSVGYGASFNGVAALLSMLNSCSSTVSVVNIDNGFGAGYIASLHIRQLAREREAARAESAVDHSEDAQEIRPAPQDISGKTDS